MAVGFVMLCHTALDRAAEAARFLAAQGCPVVIHIDRKAEAGAVRQMQADLAGCASIRFSRRYRCEWGTWGIVAATQDAAAQMLRDFPAVDHVVLASGACLPLRPIRELEAYLARYPDTDFIESVTTGDVSWTVGGLSHERFTLRFPFSWRKQRRLFDRYVALQRRLGISRRIPAGLTPHLGSQWWCLTRRTLSAILEAPERPHWDRYFRRVWIPDESYFQTLARRFSTRIESRSLTLARFDFQGKPHVFYDDHLPLLRRSGCFVARKIWPHAGKLYEAFLTVPAGPPAHSEPNPGKIDRLFAKAAERRTRGRPGLLMQSRFPYWSGSNGLTASSYSVLEGFSDLFENFETWLIRTAGTPVHGHLFAPERVEFQAGATEYSGALGDSAALRDYNTHSFLASLIWNARGERQCFQFGPRDTQWITPFLTRDSNARISVITGAWAVTLFHAGGSFDAIRKEAARLQKIETAHLAALRAVDVRATVRIRSLADCVENPVEPLQTLLEDICPGRPLTELPQMADLGGFGQFLQELRNQGMKPVLTGDFPVSESPPAHSAPRNRPYLVK